MKKIIEWLRLSIGSVIIFFLLPSMFIMAQDNIKSSPEAFRLPVYAISLDNSPLTDLSEKDIQLFIDQPSANPIEFKFRSGTDQERLIVILIDAMFSSNYGLKRSRDITNKIIETGNPSDQFVLMINSASDGLKIAAGPTKNKTEIIRALKKTKLFPGSTWLQDMFFPKTSSEGRFDASSDHRVNQFLNDNTTDNKAPDFKNQYIQQINYFTATLMQMKTGLQMVSKPKVIYYFSEGFQEKEYFTNFDQVGDGTMFGTTAGGVTQTISSGSQNASEAVNTLKLSGVIAEYFRQMVRVLKETGGIIYVVNPGKLKTMDYSSSGAMNLEFLAGDPQSFFQGLDTEKLMQNLIKSSTAYYELTCPFTIQPDLLTPITLKTNRENIHFFHPRYAIKTKTYGMMSTNDKKKYAISSITGGFLGKLVGDHEIVKTNYRVQDQYQYIADFPIPVDMQNLPADIFILVENTKTKIWTVNATSKILTVMENINIQINSKKNINVYLVIVNPQTTRSLSSQLNL